MVAFIVVLVTGFAIVRMPFMPVRFVVAVLMRRFQEADGVGYQDAGQQRRRELHAIVPVELDFRQNVSQRDAEKDACGESESQADHQLLVVGKTLDA